MSFQNPTHWELLVILSASINMGSRKSSMKPVGGKSTHIWKQKLNQNTIIHLSLLKYSFPMLMFSYSGNIWKLNDWQVWGKYSKMNPISVNPETEYKWFEFIPETNMVVYKSKYGTPHYNIPSEYLWNYLVSHDCSNFFGSTNIILFWKILSKNKWMYFILSRVRINWWILKDVILPLSKTHIQVKTYYSSRHNKHASGNGTISFSADWFNEIKNDLKSNGISTDYTLDHPLFPSHKYFSSKEFIFWKHLRKTDAQFWI